MSQIARYYNESLKYLDGQGARKDPAEAFRLNVLAADEGMHDAVLAMGWFYRNGVGVDLDIEESKRWYRKSARQKDPRAMFSLGEIFYDERDYDEALIWFQRAIDAGHARSLARHDVLERSRRAARQSTGPEAFHARSGKESLRSSTPASVLVVSSAGKTYRLIRLRVRRGLRRRWRWRGGACRVRIRLRS